MAEDYLIFFQSKSYPLSFAFMSVCRFDYPLKISIIKWPKDVKLGTGLRVIVLAVERLAWSNSGAMRYGSIC